MVRFTTLQTDRGLLALFYDRAGYPSELGFPVLEVSLSFAL